MTVYSVFGNLIPSPLSDTAIKNAKPTPGKPFKMPDEKGMYLLLHPNSSKYFRLDYRFEGKRKTLALGVYPDTSVKQARERLYTAKQQIADGIDPGENKKAVKASKLALTENSLEIIAREWGQKHVTNWEYTTNRIKRRLEINIFPWLGSKPIAEIKPMDVLACLRRVEGRGAIETAHRVKQITGRVFRYAVATGRVDRDITRDLDGALPAAKGGNFASMTDPKQVAGLLRAIDDYSGSYIVKSALQLVPLVVCKAG